ncbi:MAG: hypothetical protein K2L98_00755 [Bacilli bacterium]|nr:hypothetical protein [Bacilli bacterium]
MKTSIYKIIHNLGLKKDRIFNHYFKKYVIDYKIEDEKIKIIASNGKYRFVKNNKTNMKKINQAIVKNKVEIASRIDNYEAHSTERLTVLVINIALLLGCGIIVPFSFFTGYYLFFLLSIIAFSLSVVTTSISGFNYYMLVKEIQYLKKITGYKRDMEFIFPSLDVKYEKSHN